MPAAFEVQVSLPTHDLDCEQVHTQNIQFYTYIMGFCDKLFPCIIGNYVTLDSLAPPTHEHHEMVDPINYNQYMHTSKMLASELERSQYQLRAL